MVLSHIPEEEGMMEGPDLLDNAVVAAAVLNCSNMRPVEFSNLAAK